jgi:pimeloyl-ACP methyl ester carboxylesterase
MKHIALALGASTLMVLVAAYYGAPWLSKPLLVGLNRSASGLAPYTVHAAGHQVHYLAGGAGEPVVLLHGIFAEKDHWVDFARALDGRWRIIAPDLPGFGESGRHDRQDYGYGAQVERLAALLEALRLPRVHLAGNSMGGTLAALFAIRYPQRVASVALIGSPHGIRSPLPSEMDRLIAAGRAPLVARDPAEFAAMLDLVFARRPFLPYPVLAQAETRALSDAPSNLRLWQMQLQDRHLLQTQLPKLRHPTLALWGDADRVFHPSGAGVLRAAVPQAQVRTMAGLGHLPMMEAPQDSARAYADFLRTLPAIDSAPFALSLSAAQ